MTVGICTLTKGLSYTFIYFTANKIKKMYNIHIIKYDNRTTTLKCEWYQTKMIIAL